MLIQSQTSTLQLNFSRVERASVLRVRPIGIGVFMVNEAVRGVVPPSEWAHPEHLEWFRGFIRRLHHRFLRQLTDDQREAIADVAGRPLSELYSFFLDPQMTFSSQWYRPDPDLNAVTYLYRAYGTGAVRDILTAVKEEALLDPQETLCYSVCGVVRYLQAIW